MIAWRMLTTGEPYRDEAPKTTTDKLAKLRVAATGEKRRRVNPQGVKSEAKTRGRQPHDPVARRRLPERGTPASFTAGSGRIACPERHRHTGIY